MSELIDTFIEIKLKEDTDFLKIKETLTRIGIASRKEKIIWQSCHILHKRGKHYIVHFKELFALDGKPTAFSDDDLGRRNTIANLLAEWKLLTLVDPALSLLPRTPMSQIKIIAFKDKAEWRLDSKYTIGHKLKK